MAAAVAGTDIDNFIREQKAKLATERTALIDAEDRQGAGAVSRRQWDRQAGREAPLAVEQARPRTQENGLPLNNNRTAQKQRQLANQRKQEYNDLLRQDRGSRGGGGGYIDDDEISNPSIIPFNRADEDRERKRRMEVERQREYQQIKAKLEEKNQRRGRPEVNGTAAPPERRPRGNFLLEQTDEYKASLPTGNDSDLAKMEKERQRNEEYNQYLRENTAGRRTRISSRAEENDSEYYATLPGLRDSSSAKVRKEQQRNREYNEFLASRASQRSDGKPPVAPRRGWATPTYEEILDKKREEEAQYRRAHDPGYGQPSQVRESIERPRNRSPDRPPRAREASRERPSDCYATLPIGPMASEDAKRRQKEQYRDDLQRQMREAAEGRKREKQAEMNITYSGEKVLDMKVDYSGFKDPEERKRPPLPMSNASRPPPRPAPQSSYPSAADSLDKLDQLNTRPDISRGRPRFEEERGGPSRGMGGGLLDTPFNLSRGVGGGLLDSGFSSLLEAPRHSNLAPPPGLEYQPASYVTQGGGPLSHVAVDDAYNFYATHNPLDADLPVSKAGGGGGGGGGSRPPPSSQDRAYSVRGEGGERGGGGLGLGGALSDRGGGGGRSRVRFEDEAPRQLANMDFPNDDDKKREAQRKAQAYQEELNRQIEEKKKKKMREKEEKERFDRKLEQEAATYNPYGRGGGGAPVRDAYGNIVTDLRAIRRDNDNPDSSRRAAPPPPPSSYPSQYSPRGGGGGGGGAGGVRDDLFGPPPVQTTAEGEQSHARGGHGIFGLPKTNEEKVASEKYKDDLRKQIEERKIEQLRKKQLEQEEEEREQRRLEEQRIRMQHEYEEEQRKLKEKEEEARKKNEELVRQAEDRKREAERKRKEADEQRMEEERRQKEAEINARLANVERGKSPVIPALRNKSQENDGEARGNSPPVPAARTRAADDDPVPSTSKEQSAPPSRATSADVLNQLAMMRKQLQNERQRVEDMLETEKKAPDVFDPRLAQKPPAGKPDMDVFETARQGNAVAVRRTPGDRVNGQVAEDFNALKHKDDSDSRKEFRKLFPDRPGSGDALEAQQAALIQQQERTLRAMRDQRESDQSGYPKVSFPPKSPHGQSGTPQQLTSNSAFVDVDGLNYFPDDFDDMPGSRRNESARARRRGRLDSSPRVASRGGAAPDPFGSTTSLNVDRLAKKNEDRLKRLREMQGDDVSLYDADDVLDRFMSKQSQNRPPSGQTLNDDSWLYSGAISKAGY